MPSQCRHIKLITGACCAVVLFVSLVLIGQFVHSHCSCQSTVLDHTASNSSSSSSFRGPDLLAECQYLGRTPTCYHNDTLMHTKVSRASSQFKHQTTNSRKRSSVPSFLKVQHAVSHTILRQTRHTCLIPYEAAARSPRQPASLPA